MTGDTTLGGLFRLLLLALLLGGLWWLSEVLQQGWGSTQTLQGRVDRVRDGDTLVVAGRPVRLKGITCDERGTPLGDRAGRVVRGRVLGATLSCTLTGETSHDRVVGWCQLPDGTDLGAWLIEQGLCGRCPRFDPLRKYAAVQRRAGPYRGSMPGYCQAFW